MYTYYIVTICNNISLSWSTNTWHPIRSTQNKALENVKKSPGLHLDRPMSPLRAERLSLWAQRHSSTKSQREGSQKKMDLRWSEMLTPSDLLIFVWDMLEHCILGMATNRDTVTGERYQVLNSSSVRFWDLFLMCRATRSLEVTIHLRRRCLLDAMPCHPRVAFPLHWKSHIQQPRGSTLDFHHNLSRLVATSFASWSLRQGYLCSNISGINALLASRRNAWVFEDYAELFETLANPQNSCLFWFWKDSIVFLWNLFDSGKPPVFFFESLLTSLRLCVAVESLMQPQNLAAPEVTTSRLGCCLLYRSPLGHLARNLGPTLNHLLLSHRSLLSTTRVELLRSAAKVLPLVVQL